MTENILITGGLGFVGSYVSHQLVQDGYQPYLFDISTDTEKIEALGIKTKVKIIHGDITDLTDITRAIGQHNITHIIHLATISLAQSQRRPRETVNINILGMNNLFEATRAFDDQIDRIVWASSETVYGSDTLYDESPVSESDPVNPMTLYGASKLYCECQAEVYDSISSVGLRPTIIYGPYSDLDGPAPISKLIEGPIQGRNISIDHGDMLISWLYVQDIARAFVQAAFIDKRGLNQSIYNVRGELATIREAAKVVSDLIPDTDISISDGAPKNWPIQDIDTSAIESDVGFYPEFDLQTGISEYISEIS
jgi:nucleoside-diphosphate-sugar epimerase